MKQKTKAMTNSPISWLGGKRLLRKKIISMFPEHRCYAEVFCGGAWVFFGKEPSPTEVINDVNGDLITFYRVVKNNYSELIHSLTWDLCSRQQFDIYYQDLHDSNLRKKMSDVDLAKRFFYVLKLSFAGQAKSFGYGTTTKPKLNLPDIEHIIRGAHERLQRTYIECLDYQEIIARYDRPHTLFYLDPPYRTPSARTYAQYFIDKDFLELKDCLKTVKGKFILSLNSDQFIYNIFSPHFRIETVNTTYSVQCNKANKVEELLIMNFDPAIDRKT